MRYNAVTRNTDLFTGDEAFLSTFEVNELHTRLCLHKVAVAMLLHETRICLLETRRTSPLLK